MNSEGPLAQLVWTILASFAGALTALSFRPFAEMKAVEIGLSLFVGASFAIFVGPWAVRLIFGSAPMDMRVVGGIFYLMASGSNILIPLLVRRLGGLIGAEEKA